MLNDNIKVELDILDLGLRNLEFKEVYCEKNPEKIIKAVKLNHILWYVIKRKDSPITDLVPYFEANAHCPQLVIKFLQEHLKIVEE
jgi:hypothetical protein